MVQLNKEHQKLDSELFKCCLDACINFSFVFLFYV